MQGKDNIKGFRARKGFTLIELLVVVLIIGILAAVVLPQYNKAIEKTRASNALMALRQAAEAMELYYLNNGKYPDSFKELDIDLPTVKDFTWYKYNNVYIALKRGKKPELKLAYGLRRGNNNSIVGRYSCDIEVANVSDNPMGVEICKSLCATQTLSQMWGSPELGCVIWWAR